MTTKLGAALREKFGDPKKLLEALGLDESVLDARKTEKTMSKPTRLAYAVLMNTAAAVNPLLAMDKKVDYPIFADLTTKNFKARKPEIVKQLGAALKGKLAIDEGVTMGHVAKMLDHIEHEGMGTKVEPEKSLDESVSEPQHKAMEAAAHGTSNLGIPKDVGKEFSEADKGKTFDAAGMENFKGFLKEKGMSEDDIAAGCDMLFKKTTGDAGAEEKDQRKADVAAVGDETPEEKEAREKKEGEDNALADKMKGMVTKDELTKSISAAVKAQRENDRATFLALDEVRPYVGELKGMTFDSAEQVYRHALKGMKVPGIDGVHGSALKTILNLQPKPGARQQELAHDAAPDATAIDDYNKRFGGDHIVTAG